MLKQSFLFSQLEYELLSAGLRHATGLLDSMNRCETLDFWRSVDFDKLDVRLNQDLPEVSAGILSSDLNHDFWQLIYAHTRAMRCVEDVVRRMPVVEREKIFAHCPSRAVKLQRVADYLHSVSPNVLDTFVNPRTDEPSEDYDEDEDEDEDDEEFWISYGPEDENLLPRKFEGRTSRIFEGISQVLDMLLRHRDASNDASGDARFVKVDAVF